MLLLAVPGSARGWGSEGHAIVTQAALAATDALPAWFREAAEALADLSNAPDRWREIDGAVAALRARRPDHFFDLDDWGRRRLPADRWTYVHQAVRRGLQPERVGFLPFAVLEEYGALVAAFADARAGRPGARPAALTAAGVLAHLVGDAAVPLHATRHHHGWVGPNPRGYTRSATVHRWFESELVRRLGSEQPAAGREAATPLPDVPGAVYAMLADSLAAVPRLYEAERGLARGADDGPALALLRERLAAAATLLARMWRTAWEAPPP